MKSALPAAALLALPILALAACGPEAQIKRQAGSWTQKIEIVKLEGKGVTPAAKAQMQAIFAAMSKMSICLTPTAAAKEDIAKNMEQLGTRGQNCKIDSNDATGKTIGLSATCTQPGGEKVKMTVTGTNATTEQDMTMKSEGFTATGAAEGVMEMRVRSTRTGECKPTDITPPEAPAAGAGAPTVKP